MPDICYRLSAIRSSIPKNIDSKGLNLRHEPYKRLCVRPLVFESGERKADSDLITLTDRSINIVMRYTIYQMC